MAAIVAGVDDEVGMGVVDPLARLELGAARWRVVEVDRLGQADDPVAREGPDDAPAQALRPNPSVAEVSAAVEHDDVLVRDPLNYEAQMVAHVVLSEFDYGHAGKLLP